MNEAYADILAELRREIETGHARPAEIDRTITRLLECGEELRASDLLSLLSDDVEFDEGMWSLIHAAEATDDGRYVSELLTVFAELAASAPGWASVVLIRVLNNSSSRSELVGQLHTAKRATRQSLSDVCKRINDKSPEFFSRTEPVIAAAT
jgi:hypothetical protein